MNKIVILDLDGPILEGKFRHHACYCHILQQFNYPHLELERYWQLKQGKVALRKILALTKAESISEGFQRIWLDLIEEPSFLRLDHIQPGAKSKLHEWKASGHRLILVTLRKNSDGLREQLSILELSGLFDKILVGEHQKGGVGKAQLLREIIPDTSRKQCLWIGDSEVDIEGARAFGCPILGVTCGIRSESFLSALAPDYLRQDLASINVEENYGY